MSAFTFNIDIDRLQAVASSWVGTPFHNNSSDRGPKGGVCCHLLVASIYRECGFDPGEIPFGPTNYARFSTKPLMEPWLDACAKFERVSSPPIPGDLLGIKIGSVVHHLALFLPHAQIVHAVFGAGVMITPYADPTWKSRHVATWRPQF